MKKLTKLLMLLALSFAIFSCQDNSDDLPPEPVQELAEITFDLSEVGAQLGSGAQLAAKDSPIFGDDTNCKDLSADYVHVTLRNETDQTLKTYYLDIVTLQASNNDMQTKVLKLDPGNYTITEFAVYHDNGTPSTGPNMPANSDDDDIVLFAAPTETVLAAKGWGDLYVGIEERFEVVAFEKKSIEIDVFCYIPENYKDFGFAWFQYGKHIIKEVCFFGDVCTKFYEDWGRIGTAETNPYFGTTSEGYDFVARYKVTVVNTTTGDQMSMGDNKGEVGPLCLEFVDNLQIEDEMYEATIQLYLPDGSLELLGTVTWHEDEYSTIPGANAGDYPSSNPFGGDDGVWDFNVGDCLDESSTDANWEFPAWIPVPKVATVKLYRTEGDENGYARMNISNASYNNLDLSTVAGALWDGDHKVFCSDVYNNWDNNFTGEFSSSLDPASLPEHFKLTLSDKESDGNPADINMDKVKRRMAVINWLINKAPDLLHKLNTDNTGQFGGTIQRLVWRIVHHGKYQLNPNQGRFANAFDATTIFNGKNIDVADIAALVQLDPEIQLYKPGVGDWAAVFVHQPGQDTQIMVVQVDP